MKTTFAVVLAVGCFYLVNCQVNPDAPVYIKWVWVNTTIKASAKITQNLEPAGYEGPGITSYLCRAYIIDHQGIQLLVPGKQIGGYCFVYWDQPQENFQVPDIPLSVTSWIPLPANVTDRRLPSKAVIGGNHWDGVTAYICRGHIGNVSNGYVVPGTFYPNPPGCFIPYDGQEVYWVGETEVLALNSYGVSLGLVEN